MILFLECFLAVILVIVRPTSSSGTLEVQLTSLPEEASKVVVCLKEVYASVWREPCAFGRVSVDLANDDTAIVKVPFTFRWPGAFTLVVSVLGRSDGIELSRFGVSDEWIVPSKQWRTQNKIQYRVMCHQHYHGEDCAIFCRDRDDTYGHYRCNSRGIKECLEGWKGADCDKPQCQQGCNEQHGYCQRPHECQCRPGWTGSRCDQCIEYPGCVHGYCVSPWQCICHRNWGGILCDQDLNYCGTHQPCLNEGQCENVAPDQYRCKCRKGFSGINCEIVLDPCATSPCVNGGTCMSNGNNSSSFSCVCPAGWTGHRCENNVNECASRPCHNAGTCIDLIADFRCLCPQGWTGRQCQIDVDECNSLSPCIHATRCLNLMGSFNCECLDGFTGQLCEVNVNECASGPCLNGGTCIDLVGEYQCVCPIGYTGSRCEVVDESVCHHQGGGRGWWEVIPGESLPDGCSNSRLCHCDAQMRVKCLCVQEERLDKCFDSASDLTIEFDNGLHLNSSSHEKVCSLITALITDVDQQIRVCCDFINQGTIRLGTSGFSDEALQTVAKRVSRASFRSMRIRSVSLSLSSENSTTIITVITIISVILSFSLIALLYATIRSRTNPSSHNEPVRRVHNNLYTTRPISLQSNNPNNSPRANNERPASVKV